MTHLSITHLSRQRQRSASALVWTVLLGAGLLLAAPAPAAPGAVYTMTNSLAGNEVLVFERSAKGSLTPAGSYATEGQGSGGGLGNQGAVTLSSDERWLFVVNPGSSDLSVFAVAHNGLQLVDRRASGGLQPISVTSHRDLVYVLNEGGAGSISGFRLNHDGRLSPLAGSTQPLSAPGVDPAQIAFDPSGRFLVVTEKDTNQILTYAVDGNGVASPPAVHPSAGVTPFGFEFGRRGQFFVSEAAGGAPGAGTASSYRLLSDGELQVITPAALAQGAAACWLVVTQDGRFAYTSNTASDNLSIYEIKFDGSIALSGTASAAAGARPLDSALTNNSRFLYVLNVGNGTLGGFRVQADGSLSEIPLDVNGLNGANGLAAR